MVLLSIHILQNHNLYDLHQQIIYKNYEQMNDQNVHILANLILYVYQKFLH